MKYLGTSTFNHDNNIPYDGVLLTNLGTPTAANSRALRQYLREFLSDPRVIELPRWLWWPILNGVILTLRPRYSAKLYQKIWTAEGSPLLTISQQQKTALQTLVDKYYPNKIKVSLGMRYGSPSIKSALEELHAHNVRRLLVLPLYPQYSNATVGSTFDAVARILKTWRWLPELHMVTQYADNDYYITALANSILQSWQKENRGDKLLFSFHGIPQRSLELGDPYFCFCHKTARLVAEKLQLTKEQWLVVFQSRFGRQEWLQPYCDKTLIELAKQGTKKIDIICPGFAADCLETLEEIDERNRELFYHAGGEQLTYIPALNTQPEHLTALLNIIQQHLRLS
jgi:ferrochelatase